MQRARKRIGWRGRVDEVRTVLVCLFQWDPCPAQAGLRAGG